jgi:cell shape-determining protein MreC
MVLRPKKFFLFRVQRKIAFLGFCSALVFSWNQFDLSSFFLHHLTPFTNISGFFKEKALLVSKIESLKKENTILAAEIMRFHSLESEWTQVQSLLAFDPFIQKGTVTKVVSVNHDTKTALIAMGSNHSLKPGMFVLNAQGIVGKIETVSPDFSRIIFVTHPQFKASVFGEDSREQCIVSGNDQDCLLLIYRQTVNPLKDKENLLISQYNQMCPAGYLIGHWDAEKEGVVPAAQTGQLDYVRVLFPDSMDSDAFTAS